MELIFGKQGQVCKGRAGFYRAWHGRACQAFTAHGKACQGVAGYGLTRAIRLRAPFWAQSLAWALGRLLWVVSFWGVWGFEGVKLVEGKL